MLPVNDLTIKWSLTSEATALIYNMHSSLRLQAAVVCAVLICKFAVQHVVSVHFIGRRKTLAAMTSASRDHSRDTVAKQA